MVATEGKWRAGSRDTKSKMPCWAGCSEVAKLAQATGAPVIPIGLWGTEHVWPRSARLPNVANVLDPPTVAVRVEVGEKSLVYSSDTGVEGGVPALAGFADVLLCEATLQGDRPSEGFQQHLTAAETGRIASAAGVGRLVLTHLPPSLDAAVSIAEASAVFARPVTFAEPGTELEV